MKAKIILAGFIAATLWSGTATATLINNGDFESGDLTGFLILQMERLVRMSLSLF